MRLCWTSPERVLSVRSSSPGPGALLGVKRLQADSQLPLADCHCPTVLAVSPLRLSVGPTPSPGSRPAIRRGEGGGKTHQYHTNTRLTLPFNTAVHLTGLGQFIFLHILTPPSSPLELNIAGSQSYMVHSDEMCCILSGES